MQMFTHSTTTTSSGCLSSLRNMKSFRAFLREERLDELSKSTLGSYIKKANVQTAHHAAGYATVPKDDKEARSYHKGRLKKRMAGVRKATNRLKKADKPKKTKPVRIAKKHQLSSHGVSGLISRGISSGIKKGIIGVARKVLK